MLDSLLLIFFYNVFGYSVSSNIYYITPSHNESCIAEPCVTISQFVANHSLSSTTTLIFLSGNHKLDVDLWFIDVAEVKLQTDFKSNDSETELDCVDSVYLDFQSIEYILLKGLKLIGCFAQIYHVHHVLIEESVFIGKENSGTAVELSDSAATIVSSSFHFNRAGGLHRTYFSKWFLVAGVMLMTSSNLTVINSTFDENTAETGGVIYAEQNSNITLSNSAFTGNQIICVN